MINDVYSRRIGRSDKEHIVDSRQNYVGGVRMVGRGKEKKKYKEKEREKKIRINEEESRTTTRRRWPAIHFDGRVTVYRSRYGSQREEV